MKRTLYALVTPAKNEEKYIAATIESVLAQTVPPTRWVIVSDCSVDRTDEIVESYARQHSLLELVRVEPKEKQQQGSFASKAIAFHRGYQRMTNIPYEFIGNVDADVTLEPTYYERVLERLTRRPDLGIGGGVIMELIRGQFVRQNISMNSVAGAVQLFRRDCFESIGGYLPVARGGIDAAAEISARARGWRVETFPDILVYHHRRVTTGGRSIVNTRFRQGATNYLLGYHPLFQIASAMGRIFQEPMFVGSAAMIAGYMWSSCMRRQRALTPEIVTFLRAEQLERLKIGKKYKNDVAVH